MDLLSLIGLTVAIAAILGGQVLEGGHVSSLLQLAAAVIVFGGTLGAVMLQTPFTVFVQGLRMAVWVVVPPRIDYARLVEQMTEWGQLARKEGLLTLERYLEGLEDPFVRKGLQLLVDGTEPEKLKETLEVDLAAFEERLRAAARIWEAAAGYAPTIGILGAVLGLIHVMENLSDPSKLGSGIAVAFVATVYGVGAANLFFLPVTRKLQAHIARHVTAREMLLEGFLGIAVGENPRLTAGRMEGYLA